MRPALVERLFPRNEEQIATVVDLLGECEAGDPGAMRAVLAKTGKLVARLDVRAAAGGIGEEAFAELLFDSGPDTVDDDVVRALLTLVLDGKLLDADLQRALDLAARSLGQPALSDLVFYGREEYGVARIMELARAHRGKALAPYLDPTIQSPRDELQRPASKHLSAARVALLDMHEAGELEISSGEVAAASFAALLESEPDVDRFIGWLGRRDNGIREVDADDETLRARWRRIAK